MPPPSCRPPPTIANGCSFAVCALHRDTPERHRPRQPATPCSKRCFGVVGAAINRPLSEATQPGADSTLGAGSTRSHWSDTNAARTVGNDGAPCRWQQRPSCGACGQEVQQPEGRSPLDTHMAGRAPTKRMRGDSHAESPAPRCRAVPARTHLRSRLTPCPPPTGPPARPAFSIKARFFSREEEQEQGRLLHSV